MTVALAAQVAAELKVWAPYHDLDNTTLTIFGIPKVGYGPAKVPSVLPSAGFRMPLQQRSQLLQGDPYQFPTENQPRGALMTVRAEGDGDGKGDSDFKLNKGAIDDIGYVLGAFSPLLKKREFVLGGGVGLAGLLSLGGGSKDKNKPKPKATPKPKSQAKTTPKPKAQAKTTPKPKAATTTKPKATTTKKPATTKKPFTKRTTTKRPTTTKVVSLDANTPDVMSIPTGALIGVLMGSVTTFAVHLFRHGSYAAGEQALLVA
eukprot:gnl/MRDRNA2_/MRDRNA2_145432_c0_seq1.p1 gnl/MRDRNA2_/MRDRNA2_145432_c0~~gnl/MRDRNA2_/MRDRNA2_145432_c0_seq1.p1  ORF type:complete len:294 (-),score=64.44 gnl/MRDRNA2_/MRDRNA2_145432_c0_seq1:77-859(-)